MFVYELVHQIVLSKYTSLIGLYWMSTCSHVMINTSK